MSKSSEQTTDVAELGSTDLFCSRWVRLTDEGQVELQREYERAYEDHAGEPYHWFVGSVLDYRELCRRKSHAADWRDKLRTFLLWLVEKIS